MSCRTLQIVKHFEKIAQEDKSQAQWIYHVDIYEPEGAGMEYPVVRHSFYGKTKEEAQGYYESHLGTDEFLQDCVKSGKWQEVKCTTKTHWEST